MTHGVSLQPYATFSARAPFEARPSWKPSWLNVSRRAMSAECTLAKAVSPASERNSLSPVSYTHLTLPTNREV